MQLSTLLGNSVERSQLSDSTLPRLSVPFQGGTLGRRNSWPGCLAASNTGPTQLLSATLEPWYFSEDALAGLLNSQLFMSTRPTSDTALADLYSAHGANAPYVDFETMLASLPDLDSVSSLAGLEQLPITDACVACACPQFCAMASLEEVRSSEACQTAVPTSPVTMLPPCACRRI